MDPAWPIFREVLPEDSLVVPTPGGYLGKDSYLVEALSSISDGDSTRYLATGHWPCKIQPNEQVAIALTESYADVLRKAGKRSGSLFFGSRGVAKTGGDDNPVWSKIYSAAYDLMRPNYKPVEVPRIEQVRIAPFFNVNEMSDPSAIYLSSLFPVFLKDACEVIRRLAGGMVPSRDYAACVPSGTCEIFEAAFAQ